MGVDGRAVARDGCARDVRPFETRDRCALALGQEPGAPPQCALDGVVQRGRVQAGGDLPDRAIGADDLLDAGWRGRDGHAGGERLGGDHPERLEGARMDEEARAGHRLRDRDPVPGRLELDGPRNPELVRQAVPARFVLVVLRLPDKAKPKRRMRLTC